METQGSAPVWLSGHQQGVLRTGPKERLARERAAGTVQRVLANWDLGNFEDNYLSLEASGREKTEAFCVSSSQGRGSIRCGLNSVPHKITFKS